MRDVIDVVSGYAEASDLLRFDADNRLSVEAMAGDVQYHPTPVAIVPVPIPDAMVERAVKAYAAEAVLSVKDKRGGSAIERCVRAALTAALTPT